MSRSAKCAVCGRKVRVTKLLTLARHRDQYGHVCDNTGIRNRTAASCEPAPLGNAPIGPFSGGGQ